jgi:hypothetical protein
LSRQAKSLGRLIINYMRYVLLGALTLVTCMGSAQEISLNLAKDVPLVAVPASVTGIVLSAPAVATNEASGEEAPLVTSSVAHPAKAASQTTLDRWVDLTTLSHSERFRSQYGDTGYHYFEDGQQRSMVAGKIKLDSAGDYAIGFRASSGRSFNWAFADYAGRGFASSLKQPALIASLTAGGDWDAVVEAAGGDPQGVAFLTSVNSAGWEFYARELYFSATPVKPVTFEFGSFGFERGFSTEITTFDDDGYLTGERLRIHEPRHLFFDQISYTNAYFGDFAVPNFFSRGDSLGKSNYRQLTVEKQVSARVGVSGEYNSLMKTRTFREAIFVNTKESRIVDKVRLEGYERVSRTTLQGDPEAPRQGVALTLEKSVTERLKVDTGVASIDRDYGLYSGSSFLQEMGFSFNGDNYNTGIRVFTHASYKVNPVITAFGFYTRITGENIPNFATQGLNAGLNFDLKALINTEKRVF